VQPRRRTLGGRVRDAQAGGEQARLRRRVDLPDVAGACGGAGERGFGRRRIVRGEAVHALGRCRARDDPPHDFEDQPRIDERIRALLDDDRVPSGQVAVDRQLEPDAGHLHPSHGRLDGGIVRGHRDLHIPHARRPQAQQVPLDQRHARDLHLQTGSAPVRVVGRPQHRPDGVGGTPAGVARRRFGVDS
jgi:hypothetical protein